MGGSDCKGDSNRSHDDDQEASAEEDSKLKFSEELSKIRLEIYV